MEISFDELVARRTQREQDKTTVFEIKIPKTDKTLIAHKPTEAKMLEIYGGLRQTNDPTSILPLVDTALYYCCPALQDKRLHDAIGIKDPFDVVPALFDIPTRDQMGGELFRFLGLIAENDEEEPDFVKN